MAYDVTHPHAHTSLMSISSYPIRYNNVVFKDTAGVLWLTNGRSKSHLFSSNQKVKKNGEYNNDCSIIKALSGCHYGIILFLLTINQLNDSMYDSNHMEKVSRNQNSIAKINSMPFLLFAFQTCSVSPTIE